MFRHVLVPLDGTDHAAAILPFVRTLAGRLQSKVTLLRVVLTFDAKTPPPGHALNDAHAYLEAVARDLLTENLRVETMVRSGSVDEEILAAIDGREIDLMAMAAGGRSRLDRAVFGSFTQSVLRRSPVPVAVVSSEGAPMLPLKTLLVPVTGLPGDVLPLGAAIGLARAFDARIIVLQVVEPPGFPVRLHPFPATNLMANGNMRGIAEARAGAEKHVAAVVARLREEGVQVEGCVEVGRPAERIVGRAAAGRADAIIMSTRALDGLQRALLGSVADEVVRTAGRPVLLFRPSNVASIAAVRA